MAVAADEFKLAVGPRTSSVPSQEVTSFSSLKHNASLDTGCRIDFDVSGNSPEAQLMSELATDVWLYRGSTLMQRFRIVSMNQAWDANGGDAIATTAVCYKTLMNARHLKTGLTFSNELQADIIWDLIQHTQAQPGGDLGITVGALDSGGIQRDRTYDIGENIGRLIANLTGVIDGPWWRIDGLRQLYVGMPVNLPIKVTPIELGATARTLARASGAGDFANAVYVDGDSASTVPVWVEAATIGTDPRGRWERVEGFPTVTLQDTLQERAEGLVEELESPIAQWSVALEPARWLTDADYEPGDFVTVVRPKSTAAPLATPAELVGGQVITIDWTLTAAGELTVNAQVIEQ